MTVGELRKALEGIPDDMPVMGTDYDDYSDEDVSAAVCQFRKTEGDARWYYHIPEAASQKWTGPITEFFLVS